MAARTRTRFLINKFKESVCFIQRRNRVKTKWASTRAKLPASTLALQHFDAVYKNYFGELWPSVRVSMLSEQKYGALINNLASNADVISALRSGGCRDFIREPDTHETSDQSQLNDDPCTEPPHIHSDIQCFVFPRGDISRFKPARPDSAGLLSYYLLDAASVLPVLALDVQPGHTVLDLCAGPGGKTLAILQTQAVRFLWANDLSGSRVTRLQRTLQNYVPKELRHEDKIRVTSLDGRKWRNMKDLEFDRVLVDVPCTTDRHSLMEDENNIFKRFRTKERQTLPLLQIELLLAGLQATRPGGQLLYSTCSLSQLQNECVVERAVSLAQQEMDITVQVQDLSSFARRFSDTFRFAPQPAIGELVLPHLCANFGPIYLCKLQRVS
ncbi:5-cytosine rRNA methyltransferase NSUN4 [Clarias gariepinus]|uniref:5-methylcytosine rRNA methyltransferase NSUN4 n=1 Tax=Clarias gariepinus TaxID=13013 RepID=UPI00234D3CDF|nr:5-methylcytosine rRNA methyltransferase NSUN4 [Clarias gariepinus]